MEMDIQSMLFLFLGGLGIFLFGIKYMSDGLQKTAGEKLRKILEAATKNPVRGVFAGMLVTVLLQTSTGSTVMIIGLVNAGLLTFRRAIPMLMGANLGTTATAFLISFKIGDYALPILAFGTFLIFFFSKKIVNNFGQIFFGFGMIFFGLNTMSEGLYPFRDSQVFVDMMATLGQNPILGVVAGTVFTMLVQSSSAAIGVLQTMAVDGLVTLDQALPILFGDNIGTTITAVLASIGATLAARRAALVHVIFNVTGTILFLIILPIVQITVVWMSSVFGGDIAREIAYAHGLFNSVNVLLQFPLIAFYAYFITKIIRGEDDIIEHGPQHLEPALIKQPSFALEKARHEVVHMGTLAKENVFHSTNMLIKQDPKEGERTKRKEEIINDLNREIVDYLTQISGKSMNQEQSAIHSQLMHNVTDIERVGDHCENLMELSEYSMAHKINFSEEGTKELEEMIAITSEAFSAALRALENLDLNAAMEVLELEGRIDEAEKEGRKSHVQRMNNGICTGASGMVFLDMLSNLERIGDHASNMAESVIQLNQETHAATVPAT
ncbi:Na/Pi cotransporter family protein [Alkalicoccus daliensis]|uniref:Phosphate:Na+ symporter n=1 Tax=Alkalicoccus daliensis TaxID=745820 RepID=A0A1H0GYN6_9BACI|nr:Na/Pi cotransporter family protein [Alkalicoccus daliensis]SDO12015.1 phosphate:Na+ symporter [Alkalicoccus daliensis]